MKVDADGERLIVSAKKQVVLRFGKESIMLTKYPLKNNLNK